MLLRLIPVNNPNVPPEINVSIDLAINFQRIFIYLPTFDKVSANVTLLVFLILVII